MKNKHFRFLDLSGYMFSGKAAISNMLQEIRGFYSPHYHDDFDLIRISGGIVDLEQAIIHRWSPIRSDAALRRFARLVDIMARKPKGLSKLYKFGFNYEERYPTLKKEAANLIEKLTSFKVKQEWPFSMVESEMCALEIFLFKLRRRVLNNPEMWPKIDYCHVSGETFYELIQEFIENVLSAGVGPENHTIIINNTFEPYRPQDCFRYFRECKCIVVDRDPRDVFITGATYSKGHNDFVDVYKMISCSYDVDDFIRRRKILVAKTDYTPHRDVLRIKFEELVFKYDRTRSKIFKFLGIDESDHVCKFRYFDPEKSKDTCRMWAKYADQDAIRKIEKAFSLAQQEEY